MKSSDPESKNDSLSALLQEWKINAELPPRFQENVWRGIERAETRPLPGVSMAEMLKALLERVLPRPAMALAYIAVMLAVGGTVGLAHGHQESRRLIAELEMRYVQSVDPYQANP